MRTHYLLFVIAVSLLMISCSSDPVEPQNPYGVSMGKISFYTYLTSTGYITVSLNGTQNVLTKHVTSGAFPSCDNATGGVLPFVLPAGDYLFSASAQDGTRWNGNIHIVEGTCRLIELQSNGLSHGGTDDTVKPTPTHTTPGTQFISNNSVWLQNTDWWLQSFMITETTQFMFRFTSQYNADAAILTPDNIAAFKNNLSLTGIAVFDNQFGYKPVTLQPGTYYVACRNQSNNSNSYSVELDYTVTLPASDRCTYYDQYASGIKALQPREIYIQPFTVQKGFRYFLDGNNSGLSSYLISSSDISNFTMNKQFNYYPEYSGINNPAQPGFSEIDLPPGNYALALRNETNEQQTLGFVLDRWKED